MVKWNVANSMDKRTAELFATKLKDWPIVINKF